MGRCCRNSCGNRRGQRLSTPGCGTTRPVPSRKCTGDDDGPILLNGLPVSPDAITLAAWCAEKGSTCLRHTEKPLALQQRVAYYGTDMYRDTPTWTWRWETSPCVVKSITLADGTKITREDLRVEPWHEGFVGPL